MKNIPEYGVICVCDHWFSYAVVSLLSRTGISRGQKRGTIIYDNLAPDINKSFEIEKNLMNHYDHMKQAGCGIFIIKMNMPQP
ncbi:hypothetical protein, partial [Paenibacillus terrae]|uniref:hypothetical protein n=1 Tax=Paenibacillus terrae TaxID=159743 RepID=UPI001BAE9C20